MINGKKVIGIIGGMGPMATADLFRKLVSLTDADSDREHIHVLIDNDPSIPDRTDAILYGGESPVPLICAAAHRLEAAGADVLIMPCNTGHYFHEEIASSCAVPLLSMPEETAAAVKEAGFDCVGLLATDGSVKTDFIDRAFAKYGIRLLRPDAEGQAEVMRLIYDEVKSGLTPTPERLFPTLDAMSAEGAQGFVLGCTELPLAFEGVGGYRFIDPTAILAVAAIKAAGYGVKNGAQECFPESMSR